MKLTAKQINKYLGEIYLELDKDCAYALFTDAEVNHMCYLEGGDSEAAQGPSRANEDGDLQRANEYGKAFDRIMAPEPWEQALLNCKL